jgi:predicted TIM-barrel fold metal-dependent hydrolase
MAERLISADSHAYLADDVIKSHLSSKLKKVWDEAKSKQEAYDEKVLRAGQPNLQMEDFVDLEASKDPGYHDPHARLKAMDRDQVEAEVIFSEVGGSRLATPELMGDDWAEAFVGFNDAMADFSSVAPDRLLSAYHLPLFDIDFAIKELDRLAAKGARAVQIPSFPSELGLPEVHDKRYERLWSKLEETGITILNHLEIREQFWNVFRQDPTPQKGIFTAMPIMQMHETIMFWILTGTLERHSKLKVILVEPFLGWIPQFMAWLDMRMEEHYEFPGMKMKPSEYFQRNMGATFMHEPEGLANMYKTFGPDCLYWSTDFPHPATCWPNSQQQVIDQFAEAGIPEADRRKIVCDNAAKAFNLGLK